MRECEIVLPLFSASGISRIVIDFQCHFTILDSKETRTKAGKRSEALIRYNTVDENESARTRKIQLPLMRQDAVTLLLADVHQ